MLRGTTLVPPNLQLLSEGSQPDHGGIRRRLPQSAPRLGDEFGGRLLPVPRTPGFLEKQPAAYYFPASPCAAYDEKA